jgi:hypothetical protein
VKPLPVCKGERGFVVCEGGEVLLFVATTPDLL